MISSRKQRILFQSAKDTLVFGKRAEYYHGFYYLVYFIMIRFSRAETINV